MPDQPFFAEIIAERVAQQLTAERGSVTGTERRAAQMGAEMAREALAEQRLPAGPQPKSIPSWYCLVIGRVGDPPVSDPRG